jgi:hypothetical protein
VTGSGRLSGVDVTDNDQVNVGLFLSHCDRLLIDVNWGVFGVLSDKRYEYLLGTESGG